MEASRRRDELLEEVRALQAAGKIRQAKQLFKRAQEVRQRLTAFEEEFRRPMHPQ